MTEDESGEALYKKKIITSILVLIFLTVVVTIAYWISGGLLGG